MRRGPCRTTTAASHSHRSPSLVARRAAHRAPSQPPLRASPRSVRAGPLVAAGGVGSHTRRTTVIPRSRERALALLPRSREAVAQRNRNRMSRRLDLSPIPPNIFAHGARVNHKGLQDAAHYGAIVPCSQSSSLSADERACATCLHDRIRHYRLREVVAGRIRHQTLVRFQIPAVDLIISQQ